jgi:hypothetical protein
MSRCVTAMGGDVTPAACAGLRQTALTLMLITTDAFNWLASLDYCPVVVLDAGNVAHLTGVCSRGCFAGDTEMLTGCADGGEACTTPASQLTADDTLMSLTDQSSVPNIKLEPRSIGRTVRGPEEPPLFVFALGNGSTLRVTQHHPMVLANGSIVEASHVDRGAAFAGSNGKPVAVTSISRERTKGDVYNFETASNTQLGHIIVAEGVLVGDLKLQNNVAFEERSIELRR